MKRKITLSWTLGGWLWYLLYFGALLFLGSIDFHLKQTVPFFAIVFALSLLLVLVFAFRHAREHLEQTEDAGGVKTAGREKSFK